MSINNASNLLARNTDSPFVLFDSTLAHLPDPTKHAIALLSDGDGGNIRVIYSDGVNWRFVFNNQIVSSTPQSRLSRVTQTINISNLAVNTNHADSSELSATFVLLAVQTSTPVRVRLYTADHYRDADLNRAIGVNPVGDHGLIFEGITTQVLSTINLAPIAIGSSLENQPSNLIPYCITNLGTADVSQASVIFTYIPLE